MYAGNHDRDNLCYVQKRNLAVDDFVIVSDPNEVRGKWSTGRVVQVFPSMGGLVRNVKVTPQERARA